MEMVEKIVKLGEKGQMSILISPSFRPILYILWGHISMFLGFFQKSQIILPEKIREKEVWNNGTY